MAPEAEPPSAPGPAAAGAGSRAGAAALLLAAGALLSCWNPFAAPLGLAVGLAALLLGVRALRRGLGSRRTAWAAVAAAAVAAAASALVLALTAGAVTADLPGEPVVRGRSPAEAAALLDEEAKRTAPARNRALHQLEKADAAPAAGPAGGSARDDAPLQRGGKAGKADGRDEAQ